MSESDIGLAVFMWAGYIALIWYGMSAKRARTESPHAKVSKGNEAATMRVWNPNGYKEYRIINARLVCINEVIGH